MRIRSLFFGDIRMQFQYGFYFLYIVFSFIYIALLFVFPQSWRGKAAIIMILTDPAALGLYFLGAIILYEKGEKVLDSIAISPVKPYEYVLSKVGSLAVISTLSAFAIRLSARHSNRSYTLCNRCVSGFLFIFFGWFNDRL